MLCYALAAAAGVLGLLARRWPSCTLAALPLAALALLAGLAENLTDGQLLAVLLAAACAALAERRRP